MSKAIKRKNGYGMGGIFDQPGYEYDPVNDTFKDLESGKVFSKEYVALTSGTGTGTSTVKLEDNRIKIIDATQYTEPVEVTPSQGKDAMKKVTVTVSNIPNASVLESNKAASIDVSQYTEPVVITPTEGKDGMEQVTVTVTGLGAGYKMLPVNIRCPADSSSNQKSAVIGLSSNEFFTKTTITVEEATEFLQNTYILFYDGSDRLYYKTLLAYIRQRMNDEEWAVYSVETDKSSTSSNSIKFFGTQDKTNAKACNLSLYKLNNSVLTEPFDFVQWSS